MDLDESDNNINIINFNSDQRSDNNNANIIRNNPSENDYQFCGLISGMNRYKTISLGNTEKINNRSLVEITGEAGTGKSKLCYYFALKTILPEKYGGLEKSCLLVTTYKRLNEENMSEFFDIPAKNLGLGEEEEEILFRRLIYKHLGFEDFQHFFNEDFEKYLIENKVQTLIIDNISCLCDEKFQGDRTYNYPARHKFLFDFFFQLNGIILRYNLFCFCVNEVRASIGNENFRGNSKPAMGKTWENNLGTRLFLKRNTNNYKRWIQVDFSNFLIKQNIEFKITNNGIEF
jgi:hypothetical protein